MATILRRYCPVCKTKVAAVKRQTNHLLHFLISLFIWPWLVMWILIAGTKGYACSTCGATTKSPLLRSLVSLVFATVAGLAVLLALAKVFQTFVIGR